MKTIFLTRKQYDVVVDNWDAVSAYLKCKHSWNINGVTVTGKEQLINRVLVVI